MYDSEFMNLDEAMKNKLEQIEQHNNSTTNNKEKAEDQTTQKESNSSAIGKPTKPQHRKSKQNLNKSVDLSSRLPLKKHSKSQDRLSLKI